MKRMSRDMEGRILASTWTSWMMSNMMCDIVRQPTLSVQSLSRTSLQRLTTKMINDINADTEL